MAYELAALARADKPFRVIQPTATQEAELLRLYTPIIQTWRNAATNMLAAYTLASATGVLDPIEEEDSRTAEAIAALLLLIRWRSFFGRVESWHRSKWLASVASATGVDATFMTMPPNGLATQPVMNRRAKRAAGLAPALSPIDKAVADAVASNTALIRSVSNDTRARINNAVISGIRRGASKDEVARQINKGLVMSRERAKRIASNEMDNAVKAMTMARMEEAGVQWGEWEHNTPVERARISHLQRDKKVFRIGAPIWQELYLPFCRCQMRPRLAGLF